MKKIYLLLLFFCTYLASLAQSLYEPFAYPAGENIGGSTSGSGTANNNWTTQSNSQAGTITVLSGSLAYAGLQSSTGNRINLPGSNSTTPRDINRPTGLTGTPTAAYFSFLLNVTDATQLVTSHADNGYFISFGNTAGASVTTLFGRVSIRSVNSGANFRLGVQNTTGTGANYTDVPTDLSFGTTYLVVVKYDFNGASNDIVTIWINPSSPGGTEPAGGTINSSGNSTSPATFASIVLRNAPNTPKADVDEIRVGDSWASVTPSGTAASITTNQASLSGFTYVQGTGPSSSQSFTVTAANLSPTADNITVTGSSSYETSTDNTNWLPSVTIPYTGGSLGATAVYVRLKAGLSAGTYNSETIALSGGGATASVLASGSVTGGVPSVSAAPVSLSGFTTSQGTPSPSQSFTVTGSNLTADVIVTAPADYEVSLSSGSGFGTSVTIPQTGGTIAATLLYVRIRAATAAGTPSGNVTVASSGATTQNVAVSGTVHPSPSISVTPAALSGFTTTQGTASAAQSFDVSGSTLTNDITITAPANYEVSLNNSSFSSSVILTQSGGIVNATPVYVRLKANAMVGLPTGNVAAVSAGTTTRSVNVSGTVGAATPTAFTPGNLAVYRVGDGSAALSASAVPVYIDEFTPAGVLVQTIVLPTIPSGSNRAITASGNATTEGLITRSTDKKYLMVTGYDAAVGTASVNTSSTAAIKRVIGRISVSSSIDASTVLADFASGGNPRGVTSTNGTDIWVTSSADGIKYTTFGSTSSVQLAATPTNLRGVNIFDNQLYVTSGSGTTRIAAVGSGTPTMAGQTITNLPGAPTSGSPYQFFFADLDASIAGVDVLYLADDANGSGFQKYSLVGGNWIANGNMVVTGNNLRGLTGLVTGTTVILFGTNGTSLVSLTDASGYNASISGTVTTLTTAGSNMAFRGLDLTPENNTPLLVRFTKITAVQKGQQITVDWTNATEESVAHYTVERSSNGRNFTQIGQLAARGNNDKIDYTYVDGTPFNGDNFYRVKATETSGKMTYSNIVRISTGKKGAGLFVYPNPLKGSSLHLQLSNLPAGKYAINVFSMNGQKVESQLMNHAGGSISETFPLRNLKPGLYTLQIAGTVSLQKTFLVE